MDNPSALEAPVVVIGAGPAGLTAAYELTRQGRAVLVFDQDTQVGGLARTVEYRGFRFDIGGHRFFTKVPRVAALWRDWLGADFLSRPRLSRIYYRNHFFHYPLKPFDTLRKLGIGTSLGVLSSYLAAKISPIRPEVSFEDWVSNRFGRTLFRIFFESYTEKVWGMPCRTISASWAAQRIRGLSARTAILSMFRRSGRGNGIKSLVAEFEYPRLGPGMMWEACRQRVEAAGGLVCLGARVTRIDVGTDAVHAVHVERSGVTTRVPASHVISTMPIQQLVRALTPSLPPAVRQAAEDLRYRDFITVALIVDQAEVFPDNWIYIHDPSVRVGRIQNFKNWSPEMVPDAHYTCLGLEYFCFEGDDLWAASDAELIDLATREVAKIRLVDPTRVRDGSVLRVRQAYPVYDHGFEDALATVRRGLARFPNLWLVGRNGMHRYNNQDHSMLTALLAVENIMGANHDLWAVNADDEYHEGIDVDGDRIAAAVAQLRVTQPAVPRRIEPEVD